MFCSTWFCCWRTFEWFCLVWCCLRNETRRSFLLIKNPCCYLLHNNVLFGGTFCIAIFSAASVYYCRISRYWDPHYDCGIWFAQLGHELSDKSCRMWLDFTWNSHLFHVTHNGCPHQYSEVTWLDVIVRLIMSRRTTIQVVRQWCFSPVTFSLGLFCSQHCGKEAGWMCHSWDGRQGGAMRRKYLTWPTMGRSSRGPLF